MPQLVEREPIEDYRLTKEEKAFYRNVKKINQIQERLAKGLQFQTGKLQALHQIAQTLEGQKQQLLLRAPNQSVLDVEDAGMVEDIR